jgi:peptidylprolyl isomerase
MRATSRSLDHDYTPWGRVVAGQEVVRAIAVGEPPKSPDRMIRVQLMADMSQADRPRTQIIDTRSDAFKARIDQTRKQEGADFSVCDVPIETK